MAKIYLTGLELKEIEQRAFNSRQITKSFIENYIFMILCAQHRKKGLMPDPNSVNAYQNYSMYLKLEKAYISYIKNVIYPRLKEIMTDLSKINTDWDYYYTEIIYPQIKDTFKAYYAFNQLFYYYNPDYSKMNIYY